MPDRIQALAITELSAALKDVDRFVALSERQEIARRLVAIVRPQVRSEVLRELGLHPEQVAERTAGGRDKCEEILARLRADLLPEADAEIQDLRATVARAFAFAEEMRSYCSPHGVAADYANRLEARLKGECNA